MRPGNHEQRVCRVGRLVGTRLGARLPRDTVKRGRRWKELRGPDSKWLRPSCLERTKQFVRIGSSGENRVVVLARLASGLVVRPRNDLHPGDGTEPTREQRKK